MKTFRDAVLQSRFALVVAGAILSVSLDSAASQRVELSFVKAAGSGDVLPVATAAAENIDKARAAKNARYDGVLPQEFHRSGTSNRHHLKTSWWKGLSTLPVAQSDLIVLGQVVDARAHLTPSRTGLYSEFTIRVIERLHGGGTAPQAVTALRVGGAVLHNNGAATTLRIALQGMPAIGNTYVLFLRNASPDFEIITGYDVTSGKVVPLDGKGGTLGFERHTRAEANAFLNEIRTAIATRGR